MSLVLTPARRIAVAVVVAAASISLALQGSSIVTADASGSLNKPAKKSVSLN
jgi:hypothetical protein